MQSTIQHIEPKKAFKPFTLTIQVETVEDLAVLWAAFNASPRELQDYVSRMRYFPGVKMNISEKGVVWDKLDKEAIEQGVK